MPTSPPTSATTRRPPAGLAWAVLAAALALAALGAVAPAAPAAAIGGICPPGSPACGPELFLKCPGGQPSCSPETAGLDRSGWPDGTSGNTNRRGCPPGQPSCAPDT